MTSPTGVKRLDELLGGGVPDGSTTLIHGPAFSGKDVLAHLFVLEGVRAGTPGVIVLTDDAASEVSAGLAEIDENVPRYEEEGLLWYVDAFAESVSGVEDPHPRTAYVDSVVNLNALTRAMSDVQRQIVADHDRHRMVFDSVTTLVVNTNAQTAFRFLQVFLGRTRKAGGTSQILLEGGIHEPSEVRLIQHLSDGTVETRREADDSTQLRVEGFGLNKTPGWVDYEYSDSTFEIVGGFGVGRIR